jgi:hypothetical protein
MTPIKAIRAHCIACAGNNQKAPKSCPTETCPLWPYREGHDPKRHHSPTIKRNLKDGRIMPLYKGIKREVIKVGANLILIIEGKQYKLEKLQGDIDD